MTRPAARPVTRPVTVAAFVGTRADLGPLGPVLAALADAPDLDLTVLTGVAWTADALRAALPPRADGWQVVALAEPVDGPLDVAALLRGGPRLALGAGEHLLARPTDVLVVLGDRWELLHVVPAAVLAGVRVVHLHGGEVTEGAIDERVRHAVTKLADQHCVASADAADRVRGLGEPADRVHVTGAPGLDRLAGLARPDDAALAAAVHGAAAAPLHRPLALFTYHPPTAVDGPDAGAWAAAALRATLDRCGTVVATHPGMDPGRDAVLAALAAAAGDPRLVVREALGPAYPLVLAGCDVVVGNSSSGVIEAAGVGVPAVDVGDRQRGRLRGANVVHAAEGQAAVAAALDVALSAPHRRLSAGVVNPYGDGGAARRVVDVIRAAPGAPRTKPFAGRDAVVAGAPGGDRPGDRTEGP